MKQKIILLLFLALVFLSPVFSAQAHETYVLGQEDQERGWSTVGGIPFADVWNKTGNFKTAVAVGMVTILAMLSYFMFRYSKTGRLADKRLKKYSRFAPIIVRLALAASFFESAASNSFFGPEIPLDTLPYGGIIKIALYILSALFLTGLCTEIAAAISLVFFTAALYAHGWYVLTYANYLGTLLALMFCGSRFLSADYYIFGKDSLFSGLREYASAFVRIGYGFALLYTAISVKVLHPLLTLAVVNNYNLTGYRILFPHDPNFVVVGAAVVEILIALCILFGFQVRLTVLVTLFYITLSILFFKESVWPHFMLYGISLNLFFNEGGRLTVDGWLDGKLKPLKLVTKLLG